MDARGGRTTSRVADFQNGQTVDRAEIETNCFGRKHASERSESQDEMTDEPHLPRFLVRRGAWRDWMVWDRHTKGPAMLDGRLAIGLAEDDAREIKDVLTKIYIAEG
jgi:hypothetical protein